MFVSPSARFTITNTVRVSDPETDLGVLVSSEARILFLYSTRSEAAAIMNNAQKLGLTGKSRRGYTPYALSWPVISADSVMKLRLFHNISPSPYRFQALLPPQLNPTSFPLTPTPFPIESPPLLHLVTTPFTLI